MVFKKKNIIIFNIVLLIIFAFSVEVFSQNNNNNNDSSDDNNNIDNLNDLSDDINDLDDEVDNLDDTETDDNDDVSPFTIGGYIKNNINLNLSENINNDEYADTIFDRIGLTLQLRFDAYLGYFGYFYFAVNMDYNHSLRDPKSNITMVNLLIEEAYLDIYVADFFTIRAGNQKIIWGKADGLSVPTDNINPINYGISSNDINELKMSVTAMAFNFYLGTQKLEIIWIPIFQPAILPDEYSDNIVSMVNDIKYPYNSNFNLSDSEIGVQLSGNISIFSYGISFLYTWDDMFDFDVVDPLTMDVNLVYNRLMIPGFDFDIAILDVLLKGSVALFITEDWDCKEDTVKNPYVKYLVGLDYSILGVVSTLQIGQDIVLNYTKPTPTDLLAGVIDNDIFIYGINQLDEIRYLAFLSFQKSFLTGDALTISTIIQMSANEIWDNWEIIINTGISYEPVDSVSLSLDFIYLSRKQFINYDPMSEGLELAYKNRFNLNLEFKFSF
jgi:hypothetical protein